MSIGWSRREYPAKDSEQNALPAPLSFLRLIRIWVDPGASLESGTW